jgi:hypothetical protein
VYIPVLPYTASLAVKAGVDGIIVSNHGARQLDYVFPSILALEEVYCLFLISAFAFCLNVTSCASGGQTC